MKVSKKGTKQTPNKTAKTPKVVRSPHINLRRLCIYGTQNLAVLVKHGEFRHNKKDIYFGLTRNQHQWSMLSANKRELALLLKALAQFFKTNQQVLLKGKHNNE